MNMNNCTLGVIMFNLLQLGNDPFFSWVEYTPPNQDKLATDNGKAYGVIIKGIAQHLDRTMDMM